MKTPYKDIYKELKKLIVKEYGKRCEDFNINCYTCQKYLMLDILMDCILESQESMAYLVKKHE